MSKYKKINLESFGWSKAKLIINNDHDLRLDIAGNMRTYGGSFVKNLAECVITADPKNTRKLVNAFFGYFMDYQPSKWEIKQVSKML
jgi:hypothetical protein